MITSTSVRTRFSMSLDANFRTDGLRSDNVPLTCLIQQGLNRMHAGIQMAVRLGLIVRDGTRKGHGFRHAPHAWEPVRRRLEEC
ncbi:hypothetical protein [Burkholderia cepacia]|uniref:hypothetical protein n=1 Tax=Burkholderia cepacia TaxID=292 RepID=UPI002AB77F55|nr:hypothetical protein [Burkholderia cepacia]